MQFSILRLTHCNYNKSEGLSGLAECRFPKGETCLLWIKFIIQIYNIKIKYNLNKVKEGSGRKGLSISIHLSRNVKLFYFGGLDYKSLSHRNLFDLTCSSIKVSTEHFLLQTSACIQIVDTLTRVLQISVWLLWGKGIEMPNQANLKKNNQSCTIRDNSKIPIRMQF